MKQIPILLFSLLISINSYGAWEFHSSSLEGDKFYIYLDLKQDNKFVYFWYLKSYLMPNKFGDMSAKVKIKGDCSKNRLKYLSYVWYSEPMGKGKGERSNEESKWEYPTPESTGFDLLKVACSN
jgi:hypothetical protein